MQIAGPETTTRTTVEVYPSLAVDLSWAVFGAGSESLRRRHPVVAALFERRPELADRLCGFWGGPDSYWPELALLAAHGGVLGATEADELWRGIERAAAAPPPPLELRTEPPAVRDAYRDRVERLHRSSELRAGYLALAREVWAELGDEWGPGLAADAEACQGFSRDVERAAHWTDLVDINCAETRALLEEVGIDGFHRVHVVPSFLFGLGMFLDLGGDTLLVGLDAPSGGVTARARTQALAGRLKTVADPTRLAMLNILASGPRAVGELAQAFGLAQPTVSNHVKQLRDAGLLQAERRGNRLVLSVDRQALAGLWDELRAVTP